jgi:hypothetical protein
MRHDPNGPADTSMMGIVHSALRRDLLRSRDALSTAPSRMVGAGRRSPPISDG